MYYLDAVLYIEAVIRWGDSLRDTCCVCVCVCVCERERERKADNCLNIFRAPKVQKVMNA